MPKSAPTDVISVMTPALIAIALTSLITFSLSIAEVDLNPNSAARRVAGGSSILMVTALIALAIVGI